MIQRILDVNTNEIAIKQISSEEIAQQESAEREYWATVDYGEEVHRMIRGRYSESQEFAILRQKDEKPEEYQAYYDYCEQCKTYVKQKKEEASNAETL